MHELLQMMLNADEVIFQIVDDYGSWIYLILFTIIFVETGLVVVTFFPGDTLLFSAGMLAATDDLSMWILLPLLMCATILGNTSNYYIGRFMGERFFKNVNSKRGSYLSKARHYYDLYKGQAVLWSRFVPFMRSFVPFVTGMAKMPIVSFTKFNVLGGVIWIALYTYLGYFFGNIPWVKENYGLIFTCMLGFILLSFFVTLVKTAVAKFRKRNLKKQ